MANKSNSPILSGIASCGGITASFELVTYQDAQKILDEQNTHNRSFSPGNVASIRDAHKEEDFFEDTGEALKYDVDGRLIDGQHRLRAQVIAGRNVRYLIVRGLDPKAQEYLDRGKSRNFTDVLVIENVTDTKTDASKVRTIMNFVYKEERGYRGMTMFTGVGSNGKPTDAALKEMYLENKDDIDKAINSTRLFPTSVLNKSLAAFLFWKLSKIDADAAQSFMYQLEKGLPREGETSVPMIHILRERLIKENSAKKANTRPRALWLVLRGWVAYRQGETMQRLVVPTDFTTAAWPEAV